MLVHEKYSFPLELYYAKETHIWTRRNETDVTCGLDSIALDTFGDIAYISVLPIGTVVKQGEAMGTVEAAKMVDDLLAPISGTITDHNPVSLANPEIINDDGYGNGWLLTITPLDWENESVSLIHGPTLEAWVKEEAERQDQ